MKNKYIITATIKTLDDEQKIFAMDLKKYGVTHKWVWFGFYEEIE